VYCPYLSVVAPHGLGQKTGQCGQWLCMVKCRQGTENPHPSGIGVLLLCAAARKGLCSWSRTGRWATEPLCTGSVSKWCDLSLFETLLST